MRKETALDLCTRCIDSIYRKGGNAYIENPASQFIENAKNGFYDSLSEDEYQTLKDETEELAKLWGKRPRRAAGDILAGILANAQGMNLPQMESLANLFASLLTDPMEGVEPQPSDELIAAAEEYINDPGEQFLFECNARFDDFIAGRDDPFAETIKESFQELPPKKIRDNVARQVIGQPEAVKAAALIAYNHLSGRRTNAVFAGPSGCGKSEIWRCLSKEYPGLVRMMDFSRFSAEGWNGSLHLRDIFDGVDPDDIRRQGLIVVLDEADKIVCEHAFGGSGTDHNVLLQNDLLKMMDGDMIEFGEENKKPALTIDCSKVSVVMLGAFERLLSGKVQTAKHIGFSYDAANTETAEKHKNISYDDLIHAGMRREIAGRVNRIVALNPLTVSDYRSILLGPVLSGMQGVNGYVICIDRAAGDALAEQAIASGLGVRWMRSTLQNIIDDTAFDVPDAKEYKIVMRDGKLCCQARRRRKTPPVEQPRRTDREPMEERPF